MHLYFSHKDHPLEVVSHLTDPQWISGLFGDQHANVNQLGVTRSLESDLSLRS